MKQQFAFALKKGMIAMVQLITDDTQGILVRFDPRSGYTMQRYTDVDEAKKWFDKSLETTYNNGWNIGYNGVPLRG